MSISQQRVLNMSFLACKTPYNMVFLPHNTPQYAVLLLVSKHPEHVIVQRSQHAFSPACKTSKNKHVASCLENLLKMSFHFLLATRRWRAISFTACSYYDVSHRNMHSERFFLQKMSLTCCFFPIKYLQRSLSYHYMSWIWYFMPAKRLATCHSFLSHITSQQAVSLPWHALNALFLVDKMSRQRRSFCAQLAQRPVFSLQCAFDVLFLKAVRLVNVPSVLQNVLRMHAQHPEHVDSCLENFLKMFFLLWKTYSTRHFLLATRLQCSRFLCNMLLTCCFLSQRCRKKYISFMQNALNIQLFPHKTPSRYSFLLQHTLDMAFLLTKCLTASCPLCKRSLMLFLTATCHKYVVFCL